METGGWDLPRMAPPCAAATEVEVAAATTDDDELPATSDGHTTALPISPIEAAANLGDDG